MRNHSGLGHGGNNGVMNVVGFWTSESRLNVRDKREELRRIQSSGGVAGRMELPLFTPLVFSFWLSVICCDGLKFIWQLNTMQ